MTYSELEKLKELAGVDEKNGDFARRWADKQIENLTFKEYNPELELMKKIATGRNDDKHLDGLANRLNDLLGSGNFKVERLQ